MKVAFDVKGTLQGPHQDSVKALYLALQDLGCELFVWSNMYSFAADFVKDEKLTALPLRKYSKSDAGDETFIMDICIDDDPNQTWLAAHKFILARDIPSNVKAFAQQLCADYALEMAINEL